MELQGKKVLVFGSGKSGIGASDLLAKVGAFPVIYDGNAETDKDAVVHKTDGTYPVTVYAGELPKEVQDSLDLVVLSPGVPTDLPLVKSFYEQGLPVWGECIHTFLHHSFKHSDPFRAYAFHEIGRIRNTRRFVLEIMPQIGDNHSPLKRRPPEPGA